MSRNRTAALVAAIAVGLAACGGDDDSSDDAASTGASTGQTAAAKPAGEPIKVMAIAAVHAAAANDPGLAAGAKAAAKAINDAGGIGGRPVEVTGCNDKNDPNAASACARDAASGGYDMVVMKSVGGAAILPILEKAEIPAVGTVPYTPIDYTSTDSFPFQPSASALIAGAGPACKRNGGSSMIVMHSDLSSGKALVPLAQKGAETSGLKFLGGVEVASDSVDYAPYVQRIKDSGADCVNLIIGAPQIIPLVKNAETLGLKDVEFESSTNSIIPAVQSELGETGNGLVVMAGVPPSDAGDAFPGIQQFNKEMDAADQAGVEDADAENRGSGAINAWMAVHALQKVAPSVQGELTGPSLQAAVRKVKDMDLFGLVSWTPEKPGPKDLPRLSNLNAYVSVLQDGKLTVPDKTPVDTGQALGVGEGA